MYWLRQMDSASASREGGPWRVRHSRRAGNAVIWPRPAMALPIVLILSVVLNLVGNRWGAPEHWHPDEIVIRATTMVVERRIDPQYPAYGALHYYVVAGGAVGPVGLYALAFDPIPDARAEPAEYEAWKDRQKTRLYLLSRSLSALMAAAQVLIVCLLGSLIFSRTVGLLGALFLAVSPYFVVVAHFATVDTPANFWSWLSILFGALYWKRGRNRWYILAALTAGFAIGTKLDRAVVILPLIVCHVLRGRDFSARALLLSAILVPMAYVVANGYLLLSPFEFLDGTTRWLFANMVRTGETSYLEFVIDIQEGMSPLLFVAALSGVGCALHRAARGVDRGATAVLLASCVPFYLAHASGASVPWYVPFIFPALSLFAAYGIDVLYRVVEGRYRLAVTLAALVVAGVALTKAVIFDLQFLNSGRYLAATWIEENVPRQASIELGPRAPLVDRDDYRVGIRPPDPRHQAYWAEWRENLARHAVYQKVRQTILELERRLAPALGLRVREHASEIGPDHARDDGRDLVQVGAGRADYIVLVEYLEEDRAAELDAAGSGYRRVARLHYQDPLGWNPTFPFLNSAVLIFQREDFGHPAERGSRGRAPSPRSNART